MGSQRYIRAPINNAKVVKMLPAVITLSAMVITNVHTLQSPLVVLFSLQEERSTDWYNESVASLKKYGYDHILMSATHRTKADDTLKGFGITITHKNPGQRGCWASHLRAWALQEYVNRPIISVEADTRAITQLDFIAPQALDYDILFTHDHQQREQKCTNAQTIQTNFRARYATGAMLFTGNTPLRNMIPLLRTHLPIDHWMNLMDVTKKLKIGSYCPSLFYQRIDKPSIIQSLDKR